MLKESNIVEITKSLFSSLNYATAHGPDISYGMDNCERQDYRQVFLMNRLKGALQKINPDVPINAIDEVIRKITEESSPDLIVANRQFHKYLTDGVDVETHSYDNSKTICYKKVWLIDFDDHTNNDWLVVDEYTVKENNHVRRADIVVFINGIPMIVFELKNPSDQNTTTYKAYKQFLTYKHEIPSLFVSNEILIVTDGLEARAGTVTSDWNRFMPWQTIEGTEIATKDSAQLEILIPGLLNKKCLLDYILNFTLYEDDGVNILKKTAAYHQYWAVNKAVECTLTACGLNGKNTNGFDGRRIGVVWHTQGSGKSLSMVMYTGKLVRHPSMNNPTILIITDRNDLDDQLYGTFANCKDILRQSPVQAVNRSHLRDLLKVASGGIIFTTIQKFLPEQKGDIHPILSGRKNIVVVADEAHRSQYDFIDGFARNLHDALPNASFIGFTGTPIERDDRNTRAVFGDYIDQYDILRAVEDGATVPIYYESRLVRLELKEDEKTTIDSEFDDITEDEEETERQKLKSKWATLEAMVGAEMRIGLVAKDIIAHFEKRQEVLDGKAMIVCMSRRICIELYQELINLRPNWHSPDDQKGTLKVVMTGSASDPTNWQPHIRNKLRREALAKLFKDESTDFKIVLVRDMWLTGFDCPSLHTMYADKPMGGHNLMQAIARVNRVFRDKPGGLVVDYIGLADQLRRALATYTESGGKGNATIDQEQAVQVLLEKYKIVKDMYHGFDYQSVIRGNRNLRLSGIVRAMNFLLGLSDGKSRYLTNVTAISKAFVLAVPHPKSLIIRDDIGFFQEVRAAMIKATGDEHGRTPDEIEQAMKQLISRAVVTTEVIDIFNAAGIDKPDISILSEDFLEEISNLPHRNLAIETLKKLINDEIKYRSKRNIIQSRIFSDMLEEAVRKYQNRSIEAAEVLNELINIARELRNSEKRGESLGLSDDEIAFYDALSESSTAKQIMGDEKLKFLAQELVKRVKENVSIDWHLRETARAQIRVLVKRILRQYGYPPDMERKATELVLEQAEVLCGEWS